MCRSPVCDAIDEKEGACTMGMNPTAPEVPIVLDKERHLRFDFNAASKFEEVTGKNLFRDAVLKNMSATDMRAFLWACLVHEDADLTVTQVGSMMHMGIVGILTEKIVEVYTKNSPEPEVGNRPLV